MNEEEDRLCVVAGKVYLELKWFEWSSVRIGNVETNKERPKCQDCAQRLQEEREEEAEEETGKIVSNLKSEEGNRNP
eukprot:CAMPEP_0184484334 /NCGR_PEP_ID=MMETSP0113_2-20130426/6060_1 /TAXON_ID=91329 /ORGANISM="Norrisiella sphaerica, Strain BC52" /LENGTH=76 /DNA_ID=CAMNT_0026865287 /DNA_START=1045 /DNA_END=1278 /DNA_ORIENTATION=-